MNAGRRYASLHAAEAGIAARAVYPAVGRLMFRLTADVFGTSATLVAACSARGRRLWHIDTSDEWPDESLVTDHLAAAGFGEYQPVGSGSDEDALRKNRRIELKLTER